MYKYRILLKFATPSPKAHEDLDAKKTEITNAVEYFNNKFIGNKAITNVEPSEFITLTLESNDLKKSESETECILTEID